MRRRLAAAGALLCVAPPAVAGHTSAHEISCSGSPPRQTADPLSPPCVPFFDGDNGGSTAQGVTRSDITVVLYNDLGIAGDLGAPWAPSDEPGDQADWYSRDLVRTVKAQLRYFARRFQTYGRTVRLIGYPSGGGFATRPEARLGDAVAIAALFRPFAVVTLVENAQHTVEGLARLGIMSFGMQFDIPRRVYRAGAPHVWSFAPDQEAQARLSASFLCTKLVGRPARLASDATIRSHERRFGLLWPAASQRGPQFEQMAGVLRAQLARQCGASFAVERSYRASATDALMLMSEMKLRGVTTVVCYCVPQQNELDVIKFQTAAAASGFGPEWYWDHASRMDRSVWNQQYSLPSAAGFGVSYLWRQPSYRDTWAYGAFRSEEPAAEPNGRFNFELYHAFLHLFTAIQVAGPTLTSGSVARGLEAFAVSDPANPFVPSGSYTERRGGFLDSAMGWWWDPQGTPPGGKPGEGCIRVLDGGRRVRWNEWAPGDADIRTPEQPCSGPIWQFAPV